MNDPIAEPDFGPTEDALLAPYLEAVSSTQNAAAIRAVVVKVLQDPDLFAGYDQIKAAATAASGGALDAKLVNTLDLFSYGSFQDYQQEQQPEKYLPLNEPQLAKLRQLTVLSLVESACQQRQNKVAYTAIQQALQMADENENGDAAARKNRETELLLSQLLAARVVAGKLSQKQRAFWVGIGGVGGAAAGPVVRPRDVHPNQVAHMIAAVQRLRSQLTESNALIAEQQHRILAALEQEKVEQRQLEAKYQVDEGDSGGGGGGGPYDPMDLERTSARGRRTNKRSRGGFANSMKETLGSAFGIQK